MSDSVQSFLSKCQIASARCNETTWMIFVQFLLVILRGSLDMLARMLGSAFLSSFAVVVVTTTTRSVLLPAKAFSLSSSSTSTFQRNTFSPTVSRSTVAAAAAAFASVTVRTMTAATAATSSSETTTTTTSFEDQSTAYKDLLTHLKLITSLEQSSAVLNYDQMVFMSQTERTSASRGTQLAALASVIHEKATDPKLKELILSAEQDLQSLEKEETQCLDGDEKYIIQLAKEEYDKKEKIPAELEAKRAALTTKANRIWAQARQENNFTLFEPVLGECFDTAKETADKLRGSDTTKSLYTVLLDEFERGMPSTRIDEIFDQVESQLVPLLNKVLASETKLSSDPLTGKFPLEAQKDLSKQIVTKLGFDDTHGRIDVSVHPFTTSFGTADVRITSRFNEEEWFQGLQCSIHESGHAMYEQNLGTSGTSIDSALSMGCHESQSLFWERHVALTKSFWKYITPMLQETFPETSDKFTNPQLCYEAVNQVIPGLIRVEADELTYPLHVILRYKIERDVIEGKLDVKDIPQRWNKGMKDTLNVDVPDDAKGCLQDIHWSMLAIGYFPTYLIGSVCAAQLAHYCQQDIPNLNELIETGQFEKIKSWLTTKIHRHGKRYTSLDTLLEDQLGEQLNPQYFIDYLTAKYTELYNC